MATDVIITPSLLQRVEVVMDGSALLDTPVEYMRDCFACGCEQRFVAARFCAAGLIGHCTKCNEESLVRFSRVTVEAE